MSSQAQWSGVVSLSTPYRCRDRTAAHACIQGARGQKNDAGPCCSGNGCTGPICLKAWYTLKHIQCAASGTGRPHCRLLQRPSTGLPSKGPDQSLQEVREGALYCVDTKLRHSILRSCYIVGSKRNGTEEVSHISVENWKEVKVSKTWGKWK